MRNITLEKSYIISSLFIALLDSSNVAQKVRHISNFDRLDDIVLRTSIKAPSYKIGI